jgi:uncharacterized OB-fold protein
MGHSDREVGRSPLATFQAYLAQGQLAYQYSPSTEQVVFFPRIAAPGTGARDLEWRVANGTGTVYATTVVHPREGAPYNVALIDCDEGFRLMSRVAGVPPEKVVVGTRVVVRIAATDGANEPSYVFVPVGEAP